MYLQCKRNSRWWCLEDGFAQWQKIVPRLKTSWRWWSTRRLYLERDVVGQGIAHLSATVCVAPWWHHLWRRGGFRLGAGSAKLPSPPCHRPPPCAWPLPCAWPPPCDGPACHSSWYWPLCHPPFCHWPPDIARVVALLLLLLQTLRVVACLSDNCYGSIV